MQVTIPVTFVTDANITEQQLRDFIAEMLRNWEQWEEVGITQDCFGHLLRLIPATK